MANCRFSINLVDSMVAIIILLQVIASFAQNVLFDDENYEQSIWDFSHLIDTLESHGAVMHFVSVEGFDHLEEMDLYWVCAPGWEYSGGSYPPELIEFCRNGGNILIFAVSDSFAPTINPFLADTNWRTSLQVQNRTLWERAKCAFPFSPFCDNVDSLSLTGPPRICCFCAENAFPILVLTSDDTSAVCAMSYPFAHEGNWESFLILLTGDTWIKLGSIWQESQYRFGANLVLACAGVPGYEVPPGAKPLPFMMQIDSIPPCATWGDTVTIHGYYFFPDITIQIGDEIITPIEYAPDSTWLKFICPIVPPGTYIIKLERMCRILNDDWQIQIQSETPKRECKREPNPFTPNFDMINDFVQFTFDSLGYVEATIRIFNIYGHEVRKISVPVGRDAKEAARWDGKDKNGNALKQGVYPFTIESSGRIICEGTATIAR